jgi:hypothetical protein
VRPMSINRRWLLELHWIIPVVLLIIACDQLFFSSRLQLLLPDSPERIFLFLVFFNLPHIVASHFSFLDGEYFSLYKWRLIAIVLFIVLAVTLIPRFLGLEAFFLFFATWTIVHVVGQQFGIARMFSSFSNLSFGIWKYSGAILSLALYFGVYAPNLLAQVSRPLMLAGEVVLAILFLAMTIQAHFKTQDRFGRKFLWSTFAALATAGVCYGLGYPFFVVLIPRVLHDVTAFLFYGIHDHNRSLVSRENWLYRVLKPSFVSPALLGPCLAVVLAFPITYFVQHQWAYSLMAGLGFFHYYTDGFVWKSASVHRRYISISKA